MFAGVRGGLYARGGRYIRALFVRAAKNLRFLPGDRDRLWALLGRSAFNSTPIGAATNPTSDDATLKTLFAYQPNEGTPVLVVHKGGSLWEAPLGLTGSFLDAQKIENTYYAGEAPTPPGVAFGYRERMYYMTRQLDPAIALALNFGHLWVRTEDGWAAAGFVQPATFDLLLFAVPTGVGTFSSTYPVQYTWRLYDATIGMEGTPYALITTISSFSNVDHVLITFTLGIVLRPGSRGTHVRIYRSVLNEPAGVKYRVDGADEGIPIADFIPGYQYQDNTSQEDSIGFGKVLADGAEGSLSWAEYGGVVPVASGGIVFDNHVVLWGVEGAADRVYYSAQGYPEGFPVLSSGGIADPGLYPDGYYRHPYYLTFSTDKQDIVVTCQKAGPYLLVFNRSSIFRVTKLPTFAEPGFDRRVQDTLTKDHGCAGLRAAASFGIGPEDSAMCIYVSREHGPMVTNGVYDRPILDSADWLNAIQPEYVSSTVVRDYPAYQEVWIAYTPRGGTANTKAFIVDYSDIKESGVRVTGPVDVKMDDAGSFYDSSSISRFYILSATDAKVYVQDSGTTDSDEQQNTNGAGDIELELQFPRMRLGRNPFSTGKARRVSVEGQSGSEITVDLEMVAKDGRESYDVADSASIGPGETEDFAFAGLAGNSHELTLTYLGPTGKNYREDDPDCAPCFRGVRWDIGATGIQKRTS